MKPLVAAAYPLTPLFAAVALAATLLPSGAARAAGGDGGARRNAAITATAEPELPVAVRPDETALGRLHASLNPLLPPATRYPEWDALAARLHELRSPVASGVDPQELGAIFWLHLGEEKPRELPGFAALRKLLDGHDEHGNPYFQTLNDELRGLTPVTDEGVAAVREIRASLPRLPAYTGVVFRGETIPDSLFARDFEVGNVVVNKAFMPAWTGPAEAMGSAKAPFPARAGFGMGGRTQTLMIIRARGGGRLVSYLQPGFAGEAEVLFPNGTALTVLAVSPKVDLPGVGIARIVLLEEAE